MDRAICVTRSMSFWAPVVDSPKMSSSAVRPPSNMAELVAQGRPRHEVLVGFGGNANVQPSARPRAMIEILWIGSALGRT